MIIDGLRAADRATTAVLAYYKAFNAGDWEGMLAQLTEDVAHDVNQGGRESGRDAFRAFLARMARHYREELRELNVLSSADGTSAAAEFVVHGQYLVTDAGLPEARGQRYVLPAGAFFTLRDGRIARLTTYYNLTDWTHQVESAP